VDNAIRVSNRVEKRNDSLQLVAQSASLVDLEPEAPPEPVRFNEVLLSLPASDDLDADVELMRRLRTVLEEFPGEDRLILKIPANGRDVVLRSAMSIDWCFDVEMALSELLGENQVRVSERIESPTSDQRMALPA
jgi:hypothetical protein